MVVAAVPKLHVTLGWLLSHGQLLLHYPPTDLFGVDNLSLPRQREPQNHSVSPKTSFLATKNERFRLTSAFNAKSFKPFAHILNLATLYKHITTVSSSTKVKLMI